MLSSRGLMMMASNNGFDCFYQHVRGLRTKSAEFSSNVVSSCWPVIILTETWLCLDITFNTLFPPHHRDFWHDCDSLCGQKQGSCVLVALHDSIKCKRRLWLEVLCAQGKCLLVRTCYISPETHATEFQNILNTTETTVISHRDHHFQVIADFNVTECMYNGHSDYVDISSDCSNLFRKHVRVCIGVSVNLTDSQFVFYPMLMNLI